MDFLEDCKYPWRSISCVGRYLPEFGLKIKTTIVIGTAELNGDEPAIQSGVREIIGSSHLPVQISIGGIVEE